MFVEHPDGEDEKTVQTRTLETFGIHDFIVHRLLDLGVDPKEIVQATEDAVSSYGEHF